MVAALALAADAGGSIGRAVLGTSTCDRLANADKRFSLALSGFPVLSRAYIRALRHILATLPPDGSRNHYASERDSGAGAAFGQTRAWAQQR